MMKELLNLIENNARYEVKDLAALLNEDEALIEKNIKEYEAANIIAGYHTIINWDKADTEISKAIIFVNCIPEREALRFFIIINVRNIAVFFKPFKQFGKHCLFILIGSIRIVLR